MGTSRDNQPAWGLTPEFAPASDHSGIRYGFDDDTLTVTQALPGPNIPTDANLELRLIHETPIRGNFDVSVVATRDKNLHLQMGLLVSSSTNGSLIDIVLDGDKHISSTLWYAGDNPPPTTTAVPDTHDTVRLKIRREGNVLSVFHDGKTLPFPSSPGDSVHGGPVTISIFFNILPPYDSVRKTGIFKDFALLNG